jgi:hypothetical protein
MITLWWTSRSITAAEEHDVRGVPLSFCPTKSKQEPHERGEFWFHSDLVRQQRCETCLTRTLSLPSCGGRPHYRMGFAFREHANRDVDGNSAGEADNSPVDSCFRHTQRRGTRTPRHFCAACCIVGGRRIQPCDHQAIWRGESIGSCDS